MNYIRNILVKYWTNKNYGTDRCTDFVKNLRNFNGWNHLNCPPKYENKIYKSKNEFTIKKEENNVTAAKATEFAGSTIHYTPYQNAIPHYQSPHFAFNYHLEILNSICRKSSNSSNMKFQRVMRSAKIVLTSGQLINLFILLMDQQLCVNSWVILIFP